MSQRIRKQSYLIAVVVQSRKKNTQRKMSGKGPASVEVPMPHLLDGAAENISSKTDADARGKLKISKARHASDAAPRNQLVHVVFVPDDVIFIIKRLCGLLHVGISCHHNVGQGLEDTRSGVRRYEG